MAVVVLGVSWNSRMSAAAVMADQSVFRVATVALPESVDDNEVISVSSQDFVRAGRPMCQWAAPGVSVSLMKIDSVMTTCCSDWGPEEVLRRG